MENTKRGIIFKAETLVYLDDSGEVRCIINAPFTLYEGFVIVELYSEESEEETNSESKTKALWINKSRVIKIRGVEVFSAPQKQLRISFL